jgi:hypothetical protein
MKPVLLADIVRDMNERLAYNGTDGLDDRVQCAGKRKRIGDR